MKAVEWELHELYEALGKMQSTIAQIVKGLKKSIAHANKQR